MEEWLKPASLTVVFFLLVFIRERATWLQVDTIAAVGFGAGYLVLPQTMLGGVVTGDLDNAAVMLARLYGFALIVSGVLWYLTRETYDGTVPITMMMARVFSCSLGLLCQAFSYWGTTKGKKDVNWNSEFVSFGMYGQLLWLLANLIYLIRSDDFSTYPQHNIRINTHLRVDAWLGLLYAVIFIAFPESVLRIMPIASKTPNVVHLHVCRSIGAVMFTSVVISLQAPGFLHERDKRAQFVSRMISYMGNATALVTLAFFYSSLTQETFAKILLATSPIFINAAIGYFADGTAIYTPTKQKKRE